MSNISNISCGCVVDDSCNCVYIGDPCYVFDNETLWDLICSKMSWEEERTRLDKDGNEEIYTVIVNKTGKIELTEEELLNCNLPQDYLDQIEGKRFVFLCDDTDYGDGTFEGIISGSSYSVDSGMLGIVPDYLIFKSKLDEINKLGRLFSINGGMKVIRIDTFEEKKVSDDMGFGHKNSKTFSGVFEFRDRLELLEVIETGESQDDFEYPDDFEYECDETEGCEYESDSSYRPEY